MQGEIRMTIDDFDFEEDHKRSENDATWDKLQKLFCSLKEAKENLETLEQAYREAKNLVSYLEETAIPDAMSEMGISGFCTEDGKSVSLRCTLRASLPKRDVTRRELALTWLVENGHGDIVKNQIHAELGQGQEATAQKVLHKLNELGVFAVASRDIHHSTLSAWVREREANGEEYPEDLFSVYRVTKVIVK